MTDHSQIIVINTDTKVIQLAVNTIPPITISAGVQGPPGIRGPQGDIGPQGIPGPQHLDGGQF